MALRDGIEEDMESKKAGPDSFSVALTSAGWRPMYKASRSQTRDAVNLRNELAFGQPILVVSEREMAPDIESKVVREGDGFSLHHYCMGQFLRRDQTFWIETPSGAFMCSSTACFHDRRSLSVLACPAFDSCAFIFTTNCGNKGKSICSSQTGFSFCFSPRR